MMSYTNDFSLEIIMHDGMEFDQISNSELEFDFGTADLSVDVRPTAVGPAGGP